MTKPSDLWHRLTDVDMTARTAQCAICGPVSIRRRSNGGAECMTSRQANKGHWQRQSKPDRQRARLRRYGLTVDQVERVVELAEGEIVCPICLRGEQSMCVDHDHACCPGTRACGGCVRGLICIDCNRGLGQFRDDPDALRRAIAYLADPPAI